MDTNIYDTSLSLIATDNELDEWLPRLNNADSISVDLEFDNNLYRYGFNICLIQIFVDDECLIVDPLSEDVSIERLFPVFEDPDIEKVVFSFREDLRLLQSLGCHPKGIFDLDIASSLLNYPPGSLKKLLERKLGLIADSSSQQSNWYRRPLTDRQLDYAVLDVEHLKELRDMMVEEAKDQGILDWIMEENRAFESMILHDDSDVPYLKESYKKGLSEVEWHIFKALMHEREALAEEYDRPRQKFINRSFIFDLAKNPLKVEQLEESNQLHPKARNSEVKDRLRWAIEKSRIQASQEQLSHDKPAYKRLDPADYRKMKQQRQREQELASNYLKPIKKKIADDYGQEVASFMLSNRIMDELVSDDDRTLEGYKRDLVVKYAQKLDMEVKTILDAVS